MQTSVVRNNIRRFFLRRADLRFYTTLKLNSSATEYPKQHTTSSTDPYLTPSFVNNELIKSDSTTWYDVHDPATNYVVSKVPQSTEVELNEAIKAADDAFPAWKNTSIMRRQQVAFKFVELLKLNHDRIAGSIVLEQGKTFADAKGDVLRGLQVAEAACGVTSDLAGTIIEVARDMETKMIREPLGVVASICPFNFPAMIPLWTLPLTIVTGNTLVLKPSERTPGAALIIAELAAQAGCPPGVVNVVHGKHATVNKLIEDPRIKAITFVGGNTAGQYIHERANALGKRAQINMGAKNHLVVLPDADKKQFINAINGSAFGAAGQRCMAISVLVTVGKSKEWVDEIAEYAQTLKVGSGFDPKSDVGPLITPEAKKKTEEIIADSVKQGATVLLDGRGFKPEGYESGNFIAPTIITNVKPGMRCYDEEIFAPVLSVINVDTLDEAIELVNNNPYGNGVSLFTKSGPASQRFNKNIESGQVGINVPIPVPLPMFSFTGNKASFLGDLNFYGKAGLTFLTKPKTITTLWRTEEVEETGPSTAMPTQQ